VYAEQGKYNLESNLPMNKFISKLYQLIENPPFPFPLDFWYSFTWSSTYRWKREV